jgi:hypothetical protein
MLLTPRVTVRSVGSFSVLVLLSLGLVFGLAIRPASAVSCAPGTFCGTIYFTQFSGSVGKVDFTYDPSVPSFVLGSPVIINPSLPHGADGLVFDPQNGMLLVGSNNGDPVVQEVNPTTGAETDIASGTSTPFHMMVDPAGTTAWTSGIPGTPASIPLNPLAGGTAHPLSLLGSDDTAVDTISWKDQSHAFYTSSGAGGFGHFGTIDLTTFTTTCVKDVSGGCHTYEAAHGMSFDPFTGDLIMMGDQHLTQVDPTTLTTVSDLGPVGGSIQFDQGTVDGKGHAFVASNDGNFYFEDYASSGKVASPFFVHNAFFLSNLDDVAPLVGSGSQIGVPEFPYGLFAVFAIGLPALLLLRTRYSRKFP